MPHGPRPPERPDCLVELRVLDGANLYFPRPALKLTLDVSALLDAPTDLLAGLGRPLGLGAARAAEPRTEARRRHVARLVAGLVRRVAAGAGTARLAVRGRPGPVPDHLVVALPWRRRGKAVALGVAVATAVQRLGAGEPVDAVVAEAAAAVRDAEPGGPPAVPRPTIPTIAVTGTNGKTTVTRLLAHMATCAGHVVGWSNTDGISIAGVQVESGDWSGFGGAGRVLSDPSVTLAVLETARGGILLRGIGATHNDVAVVTNVSADHLGLQGINTVDELAEVKQTIVRITRADGWVVLNGDDPRVFAMRHESRARPFVFSVDEESPSLRQAVDAGGRAATVLDDAITVIDGAEVDELLPVLDVPLALSGLSRHNVSNALAATAAGLAIGLPRAAVIEGLTTFRPDPDSNPGRMNLYVRDDVVVVLDLAHNEESLHALLDVAHGLRLPGHQVCTVLGTAGDRTDDLVELLGEMAGKGSDAVVIAEKPKYLRGRDPDEMVALLRRGAATGGHQSVLAYASELAALTAAVGAARSGDVVAFMCHEDREGCDAWLRGEGFGVLTPEAVRDRVGRVRAAPS